ncbi:hypothetical protein KIN20_017244 [Parelaphostrongylus tenuis]|uniref:Uncharacterized protein n=1 Tax=Parelaphostrongylus tenuis TaxID=148309 RepID=A0AAD5N2W3_PARTN|nr:hypothetical protein KIN20_017244 [Parelaphostrongylus tenuis]
MASTIKLSNTKYRLRIVFVNMVNKKLTDRVLIAKVGKFFAKQFSQLMRYNGMVKKCQKQLHNETSSPSEFQVGDAKLYDMAGYLTPSVGFFSAYINSI